MPVFLVERYAAAGEAGGLGERLLRASEGSDVAWLCSIVLPGEDSCLCLFDAPTGTDVVAVNRRAGAALDRVVEALFLRAQP
jgi:Protein of unknown function (DUF4242)